MSVLKRLTEDEAVARLRPGMTVGIGGWGSRRKPMSLVRAILRSDLTDLHLVTYGGPEVGMLCAAGKVAHRFLEGPEDEDNAVARQLVQRLDGYRDQFAHVARQLEAGGYDSATIAYRMSGKASAQTLASPTPRCRFPASAETRKARRLRPIHLGSPVLPEVLKYSSPGTPRGTSPRSPIKMGAASSRNPGGIRKPASMAACLTDHRTPGRSPAAGGTPASRARAPR